MRITKRYNSAGKVYINEEEMIFILRGRQRKGEKNIQDNNVIHH